jgi:type I restriction enzyme S subunit
MKADNTLPASWQWTRLGDICHFIRGVSFLPEETSITPQSSYLPILRAGNIGDTLDIENDLIWVTSKNVSTEQKMHPGDIAVCMASGSSKVVGKTAQLKIPFNGSVGAFCGIIRPNNVSQSDYISFWLRSPAFIKWRDGQARGANIQNLRFSEFEEILLPLPSLTEQRRIAAKVNEQMAALAQIRKSAEEQLKAAHKLSFAYLREIFDNELARKYPRKTLDDVCRGITDGTHITPNYIPLGIPFLSVKDVKETAISFDNCRYISLEEHRELTRRFKPERGDVLYTKVGTTGIAKAVDIDREFSIFVSVALLKLRQEIISPEYLERVLNSPFCRVQAKELTQGMANRNLVLRDLKRIELPLPPVDEQMRVTRFLNEKLMAVETLRGLLETQFAEINHFRATLLRHAFTGVA